MIVQKIFQIIEIEIFEIVEIKIIRIKEHKTTPTRDHIIIFITIDNVIILEKERTTTQQIMNLFSVNTSKYSVTQNQNYRSSAPKHQRQINEVQAWDETNLDPSDIDNTETSELQFNHIHRETTDDESETENILIINKLKVENEHETPIDTKHYYYEHISYDPQK